MKNIKKILPAIALAGAIGLVGAGSASAYDYSQKVGFHNGTQVAANYNPASVEICYTVSGITAPFAATYTIPMTVEASSPIKLNLVAGNSGTNYTSNSATAGSFTLEFNEDGSQSSATKCASLNFSNALTPSAGFDTYAVTMGQVTADNQDAPIDSASKDFMFGYQLSTDQNGNPTTSSGSGSYEAEFWTKAYPSYSAAITRVNTHVEVTKTVKGNGAIPVPTNTSGENGFIFKARVAKKYSSIPDTQYQIYVNGHALRTCDFAANMSDTSNDCEFRLNHGETAYIGCSSASCTNGGTLPLNGVDYMIEEVNAHNHTPYVDGSAGSSTGTKTLNATNLTHAFENRKTNDITGRFFNIIPFIILAILATVGVVTLRKANKKNEA